MNTNRGMYTETMIERTIDFLTSKQICLIEKRYLPIQILKPVNANTVIGRLKQKSTVDYFGYLNHLYLEFEAKQTQNKHFALNQILPHQWEYLKKAQSLGATTFIIVYFSEREEFYLLDFQWILDTIKTVKVKHLDYEIVKSKCPKLEIVFPGILNLVEVIKNQYSH